MVTLFPRRAASRRAALSSLSLSRRRKANTSNSCQMVKNAANLTFLVSKWKRMRQGIHQWKNQLNQTTLSGPKLNQKLRTKTGSAATLQFPHKEAHSVTQQSEVWSPSSDMESGWACFVLLKGRLSVLGKAAHSPCWSSTFTPHFAELQSGLPYVGHSFPWPNNQAEQSEVQWQTQPRPWPLNLCVFIFSVELSVIWCKFNLRARAGAGSVIGPRSARLGYWHT